MPLSAHRYTDMYGESYRMSGPGYMAEPLFVKGSVSHSWDEVTGTDGCRNFARTGSRGVEAELRLRTHRVWANLGYSFFSNAGRNEVPQYEVPGRSDLTLAWPKHKVSALASVGIIEDLRGSVQATWMSECFGYDRGRSTATANSSSTSGASRPRSCSAPSSRSATS